MMRNDSWTLREHASSVNLSTFILLLDCPDVLAFFGIATYFKAIIMSLGCPEELF